LGDTFVLALRHLQLNKEHTLCYLHGTIDIPWQASSRDTSYVTLLKDNNGDKTKLVLLDRGIEVQALMARFPPGSRVLIREPWYKVLFDGTPGIRLEGLDKLELTVATVTDLETWDPVARAAKSQQDGNKLFQACDLALAVERYSDGIECFEKSQLRKAQGGAAPEATEFGAHKLYSNRALCHLKLKAYDKALCDAEKALDVEPRWVKAHARRLEALRALGRIRDARTAVLDLPELKLSGAERAHFAKEAEQALGLPNSLQETTSMIQDKRLWRWEEHLVRLVDHAYKVVMTTYFTASHRESMTLTTEEGAAIEDPAERAEDLANREKVLKEHETAASKAKEKAAVRAGELAEFLRTAEFPAFSAENVAKIAELAGELAKLSATQAAITERATAQTTS
jgi:tetratricopeptide (TPR) repeat protein